MVIKLKFIYLIFTSFLIMTDCQSKLFNKKQNKRYLNTKFNLSIVMSNTIVTRENLIHPNDTLFLDMCVENISEDTIYLLKYPDISVDKRQFLDFNGKSYYTYPDNKFNFQITNYKDSTIIILPPQTTEKIKVNLYPLYQVMNLKHYTNRSWNYKNHFRFKLIYCNNKIKKINDKLLLTGCYISKNYVSIYVIDSLSIPNQNKNREIKLNED